MAENHSTTREGATAYAEHLLTCARQVWFVTDLDETPYMLGGSCFLCCLGCEIYVVTAKHVLREQCPGKVFIARHSKCPEPLRFDEFIQIIPRADPTEEWGDLVLLRLQTTRYPPDYFANEAPYRLPGSIPQWTPSMNGRLIVRGYPFGLASIDYTAGELRQVPLDLFAELDGVPCADGRVPIRFLNTVLNLDGISGAPVLWVSSDPPNDHCLAGVMLRAGWFLHADVLMKTIASLGNPAS